MGPFVISDQVSRGARQPGAKCSKWAAETRREGGVNARLVVEVEGKRKED